MNRLSLYLVLSLLFCHVMKVCYAEGDGNAGDTDKKNDDGKQATSDPGTETKKDGDNDASKDTETKPKDENDVKEENESKSNKETESKTDNTTLAENDQHVHGGDQTVLDGALLKRATYVILALSAILVVYFGIRIVRSRKRKVKSYGLLANNKETMEMEPLASDSDEDMTVFESRRSLVKS